MKKIYLFIFALTGISYSGYSQNDTLLYENFEDTVYTVVGMPSGGTGDTLWYNYDEDGLGDGSGSNRPGEWFLSYGLANVDSSDIVMMSNSWTSPANTVSNWLITGAVTISDTNAVLHWESAPRQTPRYLDGYVVLVSTSNNDVGSFMDTLFVAAEYLSRLNPLPDSSYNSFTFSPGFVHGMDSTYIQYDGDSTAYIGELRPFSRSLRDYSGMTIYLAFIHNSTDDNLITIDDILVTGTSPTGIKQNELALDSWNIYPNPATEAVNMSYTLARDSRVFVSVFDLNGRLVYSENKGHLLQGTHSSKLNVKNLAAGEYSVVIETSFGKRAQKIIVNK